MKNDVITLLWAMLRGFHINKIGSLSNEWRLTLEQLLNSDPNRTSECLKRAAFLDRFDFLK